MGPAARAALSALAWTSFTYTIDAVERKNIEVHVPMHASP
jgi:hypothetical protein